MALPEGIIYFIVFVIKGVSSLLFLIILCFFICRKVILSRNEMQVVIFYIFKFSQYHPQASSKPLLTLYTG